MNYLRFIVLLFSLLLIFCVSAEQQDEPESLGLPGDNLNLYAVLKLFQESKTLESFERSLNAEDTKINNLDLNNDNKTDYIKVEDIVEDKLHNIVLKVDVDRKEQQDVAVFIVDNKDDDNVTIQLIGDEALYGKDYIVEPNYSEAIPPSETPNPGYVKQSTTTTKDADGNTIIVNNYTTKQTANWGVIRFMFSPSYVVWRSPWSWNYYPSYWTPWKPWYWHQYYGYHSHWHNHYYSHYHRPSYYRNPIARQTYNDRFHKRSSVYVKNVNRGLYKKTYSKPETRVLGSKLYSQSYPSKINSGASSNLAAKKPVLAKPRVTSPKVQMPKVNPKVQMPKVKPSIQKPKIANPKVAKPRVTSPKVQMPKAQPKMQMPKAQPKMQMPKAKPKMQMPKAKPKMQMPKAKPKMQMPKAKKSSDFRRQHQQRH
jgi:hypothetical protein